MRFSGKLSKGFVLSKPVKQENYKESVIQELEAQKRLIITRKRDGWKLFAATDRAGKVRLYTDGMNEVDGRLTHLREALASLALPPCTLLVGEVLADRGGDDELGGVQSVMSASLEKALAYQKANGHLRYMLFDVVYLNGLTVGSRFAERLAMLDELLAGRTESVFRVPVLTVSLAKAKQIVRSKGWEGLVLYDSGFVPVVRLDGKSPKRPRGCYKWKPISEDDFIVCEKIFRPDGQVLRELVLLQIDPQTGREFECGKLGSFTDAKRVELAAAPVPFVVQVGFEARYPKSGKIRNARFVRVRTDKKPADCLAPQSYGGASHEAGD